MPIDSKRKEGYDHYRIPALVATKSGALLACYECRDSGSDWANIDIEIVRSEDGGRTWSQVDLIKNNQNTLNNPTFIENDKVGDIYYAKATYLRRNGNPGGWFGDKSRSGGGPLIDLGVHVIDLTRFLMGNPKPVSVYGATFHKLGNRPGVKSSVGYVSASRGNKDICDVEDMATALIRYDNGAVLSVEASFSLNIKNDSGKIELFGTKGGVKLDPEFEMYTDVNNYLANVTLNMTTALSFDGLFENEINYFVDAVVNDVDVSSIARDGKTLMQILDAIYLSAKEQREVLID
ncbi:MAG: gfo/Idh/MocA family oxidoreductase [Clostridia bacterium]|nr:gfo/Idh/MocA family oxidoreductase [Clostridia bacterium]